ncbi:hypothetical protein BCR34DRAFT_652243 [Clohesyomyces aquaticus]|uniref:Uncharacterized protein n=1 Tax=Clohesyomyces aquaticus TaxID=1231657 RepID=A0A1Y1ZNA9_9PLEO|nr:hypothetical protein BCR34DRAFT_652243 [Clohesyomyces aquaticus]
MSTRDENLPIPRFDTNPSSLPEVYYPPNQIVAQHSYQHKPPLDAAITQPTSPGWTDNAPATLGLPPAYPEKKKKIWGLRPWIVILIAFLVVAAIIGGVVGGVLGSKSKSKSHAQANVSQYPATATVANTKTSGIGTASSSASATATPSSLARAGFKIASLAATRFPTHIHVYTVESATLKLTIWGDSGWKFMGTLIPDNGPKQASPLTAVSWDEDGSDAVRVYYFDNKDHLVELAGLCTEDGTKCTWFPTRIIPSAGISENSTIAAVHWGNATVGHDLRIYYQDTKGGLTEVVYSSERWAVGGILATTLPGSAVAATISAQFSPVVLRVYYHDQNANLKRIKWDNGWSTRKCDTAPRARRYQQQLIRIRVLALSIGVKSTSTIAPYADMCSLGYYKSNTSSTFSTRSYTIPNDKHPIEVTSDDELNFITWNGVTVWIDGDDVGGAIGAVVWVDDSNVEQVRFYYSVNGAIQEMVLQGTTWSKGSRLPR